MVVARQTAGGWFSPQIHTLAAVLPLRAAAVIKAMRTVSGASYQLKCVAAYVAWLQPTVMASQNTYSASAMVVQIVSSMSLPLRGKSSHTHSIL